MLSIIIYHRPSAQSVLSRLDLNKYYKFVIYFFKGGAIIIFIFRVAWAKKSLGTAAIEYNIILLYLFIICQRLTYDSDDHIIYSL